MCGMFFASYFGIFTRKLRTLNCYKLAAYISGIMPPATSRARNWLVTLNNPAGDNLDAQWQHCKELMQNAAFLYSIGQLERGEEGTIHLQAYVQLHNPKGLRAVKRFFEDRAHVEVRRGSHAEAKEYCSKNSTRCLGPYEVGMELIEWEYNALTGRVFYFL